VDATIALPIVAHALHEKCRGLKRNAPIFKWEVPEGLYIDYSE
jgi:deoxyhypusine synthase